MVVDCLLVLQAAAVGKLQRYTVARLGARWFMPFSYTPCTVLIRMSKEKSTALIRLESRF